MKGREVVSVIIVILMSYSGLFIPSCSSSGYQSEGTQTGTSKYLSSFPGKESSEELEKISKSVIRINCIVFYKKYEFSEDSNIKRNKLSAKLITGDSVKTNYFDKSSSGSSIVVYSHKNKIALLTCAHVINFPDTIYGYFTNEAGILTDYLASVSIKEKHQIYAPQLRGEGEIKILTYDKTKDLALIEKENNETDYTNSDIFPYPPGKAKELEWGDFVYLFGYPVGSKMISRAIVSNPNLDGQGGFLIDAVTNKGFSGGAVLAIRGGVPNFELVGILRSVPEESNYFLQPEKLKGNLKYSTDIPYKGKTYVSMHNELRYGIAKVIPVEMIREFILENTVLLSNKGYEIKNFF